MNKSKKQVWTVRAEVMLEVTAKSREEAEEIAQNTDLSVWTSFTILDTEVAS